MSDATPDDERELELLDEMERNDESPIVGVNVALMSMSESGGVGAKWTWRM
jgi:hypothetical protein